MWKKLYAVQGWTKLLGGKGELPVPGAQQAGEKQEATISTPLVLRLKHPPWRVQLPVSHGPHSKWPP